MNEPIASFLAHLEEDRRVSEHTSAAYRNDLQQFSAFLDAEAVRRKVDSLPISAVDREMLAGYFLSLRERSYAPATIARKTAALRSFLHYLYNQGGLARDLADVVGSQDVKRALPRAISAGDVQVLLSFAQSRLSTEGRRDHAMLRLVCATGMRVSELVALDVDDLDLAEDRLRVVGRAGRERVLPLDAETVAALDDYVHTARPHMMAANPDQPALVLNHRGQRLTRQGFWLILKALTHQSGLTVEVTPHTLRHSFAARQVDQGVTLEQLRQHLGHASLSTTQVYRRLATARAGHDETPDLSVPSLASA